MKLSILVPVYNERRCFGQFWERLKTAPTDLCQGISQVEIIVIDDGSSDGTSELLEDLTQEPFRFSSGLPAQVTLLHSPRNRGKGYSVRRGIESSTGAIVLIQDADLEYYMTDYPALVAPLVDGFADAVFGTRLKGSECRHVLSFRHALGNRLATLFFNVINDVDLTDMEAGYKVINGDLARRLKLVTNRFGIEPELASRLQRAKARIYEVPIRYTARAVSEGKKLSAVRDGAAAFFHIIRFGLFDRRLFRKPSHQLLPQTESPLADPSGCLIPSGAETI